MITPEAFAKEVYIFGSSRQIDVSSNHSKLHLPEASRHAAISTFAESGASPILQVRRGTRARATRPSILRPPPNWLG